MKPVSKNVSADLNAQNVGGRKPFNPVRESLSSGGPSMIVPGEGTTQKPKGATMDDRSAARAADAMGNLGKMK